MTPATRTGPMPAANSPVVHVMAPGNSPAQSLAVLGMLGLQFCFLALLAWRILLPADLADPPRELAAIQQGIQELSETRDRQADVDAKLEVLERVIQQSADAPEGILKSYAEQTAMTHELRTNLRAQQSLARELETKAESLAQALAKANREDERQRAELEKLESRMAMLSSKLEASRAELVQSKEASGKVAAGAWSLGDASPTDLGLGALLGAIVVGAVFAVAQHVKKPQASGISHDRDPVDDGSGR